MARPAKWIRTCGLCGEADLRSAVPDATLLEDPFWRCAGCGSADVRHRLVAFPDAAVPGGAAPDATPRPAAT